MKLFVEQFNPKTLDQFILPPRVKAELSKGVFAHLLLYGSSGLGKSAVAKMLASKYPNLYINASENGDINTLRSEIRTFCSEVQLNLDDQQSDIKIVILDEIDGASKAVFDALKGFMDEFQATTRFIATTNYPNKIDTHVASRFTLINFNTTSSEEENIVKTGYKNRINAIITQAMKATVDEEALKLIIEENFPDFRGGLQDLERLFRAGTTHITLEALRKKTYEYKEIYEMILTATEPEDVHKKLMGDYANKVTEVLTALDNGFVNYILLERRNFVGMIPTAQITVCDYQRSMHMVIDPALAMKACCYALMEQSKRFR